jgi:hypothetical protein
MTYTQLDRFELEVKPLADRNNKVDIEKDFIALDRKTENISDELQKILTETIGRIKSALKNKRSVMLAFGAHTIKNGLGPVLISLMENECLNHLATNGAGIIHDWEFAFQGCSSEDVRANVKNGQFGIWDETGKYINLAIIVGAYEGLGYGESVGALIENEGLQIPSYSELQKYISGADNDFVKAASAADFLGIIKKFDLPSGWMKIPHPYKKYSVQAAAYRLNIPFTGHPMIGHDIIYNHPMNHCAAIGRCAQRDFLSYAHNVSRLDGGVYLSVGSAVMSPMIFEKSLSMSQNLAIQKGRHIDNHFILVVDLAESNWDWQKDGEPSMDNPAYYMRYCKTFNRMGGEMRYLSMDNRDFLLSLYQQL